jgi:hypothetical protein
MFGYTRSFVQDDVDVHAVDLDDATENADEDIHSYKQIRLILFIAMNIAMNRMRGLSHRIEGSLGIPLLE